MQNSNLLFVLLFILSFQLFSQKKIEPVFAISHVGDTVTVAGSANKIIDPGNGAITVFMGKEPFWNFCAVILVPDTVDVNYLNDSLCDHSLEITGVIEEYKGTPTIIVRSMEQLKFIPMPKLFVPPFSSEPRLR